MTRIARTVLLGALALAVGAAAYASEPAPKNDETPGATNPLPRGKKKIEWSPRASRDTTFLTPPKASEGRTWVYVSGEVLNLYCYLSTGSIGDVHQQCATSRTKGGVPMGLLTQLGMLTNKGEMYLLFPNHEWAMDKEQVTYAKPYQRLVGWTGQHAQAGGFLCERKGMKGIEVIESRLLSPEEAADSSSARPPESTGAGSP